MATIKDVAKDSGVSIATVSRVINKSPKASAKSIAVVEKSMKALGYRPNANARALVSKSTNTIGVLVSDVSDPFFGLMIKAVDDVARKNGKQVLIGNGYHNATDERNAIELLINSRCDSLVVHSKGLSNQELIDYANEVPGFILINRLVPEIAERCIALDNFKGAYLATEFLIKNGHKQIACIGSNQEIEDSVQRKDGYLQALKDNGLTTSDNYIEFSEPTDIGGEKAMMNLLAKNLPVTATFAYNDFMAAGALSALEDNSIKVPEQMSLVGFDDGLIAKFVHPKLTTIRYPIHIMAEKAASLAIMLAKGEHKSSSVSLFNPTLIKRMSVSKI
ncbi:MAG: substrate-binding domain-containing protein [Aliivibrio sp.]|uniref:substrate-binding domain-containing protein n=1 Tax=Aliivibrio sp. TaxID=1872443 RepID=UPI001A37A2F1|nr:substrate-binding domain-containing protein [Aliivibrio sp.]